MLIPRFRPWLLPALALGIAALVSPNCGRSGLSAPCDPTGYWRDEKGRAVEVSVDGAVVTSVRLDPMYCDPVDGDSGNGPGYLEVGYDDFEATATSSCTATGSISACRWGDTECQTGIVDIDLLELSFSSPTQVVGQAHDRCNGETLELRYERMACKPKTASDYLPGDLRWEVERHADGTEIQYETVEPTATAPQQVLATLTGTVSEVLDPEDGGATVVIEANDGRVVYDLERPQSTAGVQVGDTTDPTTRIGTLAPFQGHLTLGLEGYDADGEPIDPHCVGGSETTRRPEMGRRGSASRADGDSKEREI